jgi:hypothetical protein
MGIMYILRSWSDKIWMHCLKGIWTHSRYYQLQQQKSNSFNKVSQPMSSHHNDSQSLEVAFFLKHLMQNIAQILYKLLENIITV